jgi:xanthine dehydrogenase accessory factor
VLNLLHEIVRRSDAGEPLAVCTVVRTRGSTPQKAGAVLVVLADGRTLGTIGGGCVEAEVRTRALRLLAEASTGATADTDAGRLLTFRLDHDFGWDDGLLCGGAMDVAVEVVDRPARAESLRRARDALAAGSSANIIVEVPDESGRPARFERSIEPRPALVIAGAGHVGAALAVIAAQLDFDVTVIDDRADYASPDRLGGAGCRVGPIDAELARYPIGEQTYVVIVTRGHRRDGQALAAVIGSAARYIGLIGSKRKVIELFAELRRAGVPREPLARVHAPIGLDIAAVTPAEIAVSIAAEMIAVRRGAADRPARPMRLTAGQLEARSSPEEPGA